MPLVDYRCDGCAATHEVFAASPVADAIACPACGATARRRFGLGGLVGVRPARKAKELLERERATKAPPDAADRRRLREHLHGHDHGDHSHGHDHSHSRDHAGHQHGHDDHAHDPHGHDGAPRQKESGP